MSGLKNYIDGSKPLSALAGRGGEPREAREGEVYLHSIIASPHLIRSRRSHLLSPELGGEGLVGL
jgi:hypothetical protein